MYLFRYLAIGLFLCGYYCYRVNEGAVHISGLHALETQGYVRL